MEQANEKKWCVYIHTNKVNNKVYIGITSRKPEDRWGKNGYCYAKEDQPVMYNAIHKYGWDNFEHIIFAEGLSFQNACQMEVGLIALYKANVRRWGKDAEGYNETDGGEGANGYKLTEEHKKYISKIQSIPVIQLDLHGNFIAEYNSMLEAANKIGCHISCISDCCNHKTRTSSGYVWVTKKDYNDGNYSVVWYDKKQNVINQKMKVVMSGRAIKQYSIIGDFIAEYVSIQDASRQCDINSTCIRDCCRGKQKTAGGFVWKYSDDTTCVNISDIRIPNRYQLTVCGMTLSARQWSKMLFVQEETICGYIRKYGEEKTKELIFAMMQDPPQNKHRKAKTTWFEVYGINI